MGDSIKMMRKINIKIEKKMSFFSAKSVIRNSSILKRIKPEVLRKNMKIPSTKIK